jgi:hypothetical protein
MIFATAMSEDVYKDYMEKANGLIQDMGGSCSVWVGVNADLLRSSIGITDNACRAIYETEAEQQFNEQGDSGMDTLLYTAGAFAAAGAVAFGAGMLTVMVDDTAKLEALIKKLRTVKGVKQVNRG